MQRREPGDRAEHSHERLTFFVSPTIIHLRKILRTFEDRPGQKPYLGVKKQPLVLKRSQLAEVPVVVPSQNPYGVWLQKKL